MALYAISDLHLSFNSDKPMDIFGDKWIKHEEKIKQNWIKNVSNEDTVLIAGDISWSMKTDESLEDLNWINELPGRKVIIKGNHDYWWGGIKKLNSLYDNMNFIQNNFFEYDGWAICGSRGWICPGSEKFSQKDEKIYNRELIRLKLSLDSAKSKGFENIICMIHYPPTNEKFNESGFVSLFKEYGVKKVVYGHLHGPSLGNVLSGEKDGIEYIMTSCDYIDFNPIKIL
ncbi:metallophosphoesterase [Clostridium sp. 'White wine YQ']|uniref:metallophosphoesterase n=1 Tax=Clostridium sp. 'White wine YQ' TaxID=3027474 RepID=UPI0023652C68|nr:metallophosphoesterase [Clostridium sp. 'White wine YQ']MDD7794957.1 metallophosphoesterase [Clostridium sp. 'White wine YQ']